MGVAQERICFAIKDKKGKAISEDTLVKAFKHEISIGLIELEAIATSALTTQMKKGNMTAIIWFTKNRMRWRDDPDYKPGGGKTDPAGTDVHHVVEVEGGLPLGSTPDNPGGTAPTEGPAPEPAPADETIETIAPSTDPPAETI